MTKSAEHDDYVVIGKIGKTHGIKGWLKVHSFTEDAADILEYDPWYLEDNQHWKPIKIEEGREHSKTILVKLPGQNNPEEARLLTGKKIAVKRSQLATLKKGQYYWADLEGLTVINQNNAVLGVVKYVLETGANDVLVVKGEREHAIPYTDQVIQRVDLPKRELHVDWEVL